MPDLVFRRLYGTEIEQLDEAAIEDDFKRQLTAAKGLICVHKGAAAEYRVRYRLLVASLRGATLADVVRDPPSPDVCLGPFDVIHKARFYIDQEKSVEIDLHGVHSDEGGTDLMIEVKDWKTEPPLDAVRRFIDVKAALAGHLKKAAVFLFYSESGLGSDPAALLAEADVLVLEPANPAGFEYP